MKKFLFLAMAAAAMVSCSQNEEIENAAQKAEIKLGTVVKTGTRATIMDNTTFTGFKVNAYIVAEAKIASEGLGTPYMNGIQYSGSKADGWKTTDGTFYWPGNDEMQFFAYPITVTDFKAEGTNYPTCTFAIGATADQQSDIVVAHEAGVTKPSGNELTLHFKHILTRINFSYKPEDPAYTYTISKITIKGVDGGTVPYTFDSGNDGKGTWGSPSATNINYDYPITVAASPVNEYYNLDSENGSLMLLPQSVAGKTIEVTYKTVKDGATFFDNTKVVTLPANSTWGIGQNIRYKLTLPVGAEEIKLQTEVEESTEGSEQHTPATPTPAA